MSKKLFGKSKKIAFDIGSVNGDENFSKTTSRFNKHKIKAVKSDLVDDYEKSLVADILNDFEERRLQRKPFELNFSLCMNFAIGNQHSYISRFGEIEEDYKNFAWEQAEVFNHIAPILETRLAKLGRVRPKMHVRPVSDDEQDILAARMATALLTSSAISKKLDEKISEATLWSEVCGTSFYQIGWDSSSGCLMGEDENGSPLFSGDVLLNVCSPFEFFPDSSGSKNIQDCKSLIHAKAVPCDEVLRLYGFEPEPEDIDIFTFDRANDFAGLAGRSNSQKVVKAKQKNHCLVVERYIAPTVKCPNGKLEIVAGKKLVFDGDLPFVSPCGERFFPFVRQISMANVGCFWGTSVVERCIPLQRAYNAIKNKKHELLTRLAAGVLIVEDGSVDIDNLEEEGLSPGKLLVYRNGSTPPRFMDDGGIPAEFSVEENRILDEFVSLSGVSEFSRTSIAPSNVNSGVALGLLVEQDDTRLSQTADYIRFAVREISKQILSMFKQFGSTTKLLEVSGKNGEVEVSIFESSHINSDDVCLDTDNEMNESPSNRKAMVLDLLKNGLLQNENGKLSERMRAKVLESLGFGNWESTTDLLNLQIKKARRENFGEEKLEVLDIDDHAVHIEEHTKWILENPQSKQKNSLLEHIAMHKSKNSTDFKNVNNLGVNL